MPPLVAQLDRAGTVLLDAARTGRRAGASLLFTEPREVLRAEHREDVPTLLNALDECVRSGAFVAGYLAYEAGYAFETIGRAPASPLPLAWFGVYDAPLQMEAEEVDRLLTGEHGRPWRVDGLRFSVERETYREKLAAVKAYIREGDVYQVNLTDRFVFSFQGSPASFYGTLRRRQRVSYGAFLQLGDVQVLSCSPELFMERDGDRVVTRPMKGTVRRGRTQEEDEALGTWLATDPKSRAENLMIVDLLRNDLSQCCVPGSVRVPQLYSVEAYDTLLQMTSTVEGRLKPDTSYAALFRALFPCGSVTGAPKIRAMQVIRELETRPREVYCGSIGYIAPGGRAVFNVAIRTVVLREGNGVMGTGSGIVWDSDAEAEYEECLLKARFLSEGAAAESDFLLIETMRAEGDRIALLDFHIDRLRSSARYFAFVWDERAVRKRIGATLRNLRLDAPGKIRLTLARDGTLTCEASPLGTETSAYARVALSPHRVDSADPFYAHKTTRRRLYEDEYRRARAAGLDEVLFLNERGEITEGSRTNVFLRQDGKWWTPPLGSGLLGGVYRRHMLETNPDAGESVLLPEDLVRAEGVYLCNAVQGLAPVQEVVTDR